MSTIEGFIKIDLDRVVPNAVAYVAACREDGTDVIYNEKYMKAFSIVMSHHERGIKNFHTDVEGLVKLVKLGLYV